ncbi:RBBP9/YdeN family alpha/beta hydrolase [Flavobacterium daejeonense]|uniref:RBBP9/YdeN family alpha/beta hydrolase n=1 Tax=Flavobacterium daejeonense TaxID=350893 RepID=UPI00047BEE72|nr:alpha/beta hydrolase [Flavobacterium daejeonense]
MKHTLLIVPGLGDSATGHWQDNWLQHFPNTKKVVQDNWNQPQLQDWLKNLDATINSIETPVVIVAHSLAVSLVTHWSQQNNTSKIAGALLVAPADVESAEHTPEEIWNFAPIPLNKLNYPSIVISSSNDPYISVERAEFLANQWQSHFYNVDPKGHLNFESQLGLWEEGQQILESLLQSITK